MVTQLKLFLKQNQKKNKLLYKPKKEKAYRQDNLVLSNLQLSNTGWVCRLQHSDSQNVAVWKNSPGHHGHQNR